MELKLNESDFLPGWTLEGNLQLQAKEAVLIYGANGVGKSSLLQYFKLFQKNYFPDKKLRFIDQGRLTPLNEISLNGVLKQLESLKDTDEGTLKIFQEFLPLANEYMDKPFKELSGGQNQMCKIILGLFLGGEIYFFDEPTQSLDDANIKNFACILEGLKINGKTSVVIEHQSGLVKSLCDRAYEMKREENKIILEASIGS